MGIRQVTLVTVAVCDLCGASDTHASSPASPEAGEHFMDIGWALITGQVEIRGRELGDIAALCPKCSPVLKYATFPKTRVA